MNTHLKRLLVVLLLSTGVFTLITKISIKNTVNNLMQDDDPSFPLKAVAFELLKKADPETGKIPGNGAWHVYKQLIAEGKIKPSLRKTTNVPVNMWNPVNDFFSTLSITRLAYDPNNKSVFYFCTGEGWYNADAVKGAGVWKSADGGVTWNQLTSTDSSIYYWCQDIVVHPTTSYVYVATRDDGLYRSKDGGQSWLKVLGAGYGATANSICDIEFTKNGGIFAAIGIFETDGIYYSETGDSGTWVKQTNGFPVSDIYRVELATALSNDSVAYAIPLSISTDKIKGIYKTTNKGNTWFTVADPGGNKELAKVQGWYDLIIAVDPNNENVVVTGGLNLWKSTDGGNTWKQLSTGKDTVGIQYVHVDQHEILFVSSDTVYFGNDGGIWKCDNFTDSVPYIYNRNFTYNVTQYYATAIHPEAGNHTIIGGTQDNGSAMSTGNGISDFQKLTWADGGFCAINSKNGNVMYTTMQERGMFRFIQGGYGLHDTITNPYVKSSNTLFINPMEIDPVNPEIIYMASNKGLWRLNNASTADSNAWQKSCNITGSISAIGISKSSPNTVYIGKTTGGNIYRIEGADTTSDTYSPIDCDPSNTVQGSSYTSCIYVDPDDVNHLIITCSNYGIVSIYESKNATDPVPIWQSVEGDLPDIPVNWALLHPANPEVCYIATEAGVFYTKKLDGDSTAWLPTINGLAVVRTDMLRYRKSDNTILAATHGRGLFTGKIDTSGTNYEINWKERGPSNVGGRTRAIMIDPNDLTKKTVWAGSIAGGLFKTTNIEFKETYDIELFISSVDEGFANSGDGSATVSVTGGTSPFTYKWSNNVDSAINNNLNAGTYTVTVSDKNSQTEVASVTIGLKSTIKVENFNVSISSSNPFSDKVSFLYTVIESNPISLLVYNIDGKLIDKLVDEEEKSKGYYSASWQPGISYPKGIYFVVFKNNEEAKVLKILKL